jgi:hypothetical protein
MRALATFVVVSFNIGAVRFYANDRPLATFMTPDPKIGRERRVTFETVAGWGLDVGSG